MERINVTGTSCSGKTTLAHRISERLALPSVELDALFWGAGWTPVADEVFRSRVIDAVAGDRWVIDGNYSTKREVIWARADTVVWLDYPLRTVLHRWADRTQSRLRSREELWTGTGNRERIGHLLHRDGLLWWILSTYHRRRRATAAQLTSWPDLRVIRLESPTATERWLASLG